MKRRNGTLECVALVGALLGLPQPASGGWQTYTTKDGLGGNAATVVFQDRAGNFWFGGSNGARLSRYDGVKWQQWLSPSNVNDILEDHAGNLWFGSYDGVFRYDGSAWRGFSTADAPGLRYISAVLEDRAGNLWAASHSDLGVSRFDGTAWRTFTTADGLVSNSVNDIEEDAAWGLWFGTYGGVSRYDGVSWRTITMADGLAENHVWDIAIDHFGNLWFGTSGGVSRYDGRAWQTFTVADGLANNSVTSILEDRAGNLWFGTGGGVSRYDGTAWRTFTTADGLANDQVYCVAEDISGNLWFATYGGGVSRYDGSTWRRFTTTDGLAGVLVYDVFEHSMGDLWFAAILNPGGVGRYDGTTWTTFTKADGLPDKAAHSIAEDLEGNLWVGTLGAGVSRYDGTTWTTFTKADGLASDTVWVCYEDRNGDPWFGTTTAGVSRYDGTTWRTYSTADGLAGNSVASILEDRAGNLWFGTQGDGVSRYDGSTWRTFGVAEGLASDTVFCMAEDGDGNLWFGTDHAGVSRYNGSTWRTFTTADGLIHDGVRSLMVDQAGAVWAGTLIGASRYDGSTWTSFTEADGLAGTVMDMVRDRNQNLWFVGSRGAHRHEPDRVPPRTVLLSVPPSLSPSPSQGATFTAAFGEDGVEFSGRVDDGAWSSWSSVQSWFGTGLRDGSHRLEIRSRDKWRNVEQAPAIAPFTTDATPPRPIVAAPAFGQPVQGNTEIRGTSVDARFLGYSVQVRPSGAPSWNPPEATLLVQSAAPVTDGVLASWDTSALPDGTYDLLVSVTDSLGLTGSTQVTVVVDNHAPFFDETAPAKVPAATGGDVYTTNSETHLYFPPHAFAQDAIVMVTPAGSAPASLPSGALKVLDGYELAWSGSLSKPARFTLSYAGVSIPSGTLALYHSTDGTSWERLGGTVDAGGRSISLAVDAPGPYALFADNGLGAGEASLSPIAFTPRVFSPSGGFADTEVGISFTLGKPAPVTVRVFSRSGRLIREVISGTPMSAGENLVRWDGRSREGGFVVDGVYFVTVEALGRTETKPLAVVK